jgi:hypothetical protein
VTLAEFLLARIAEDEENAKACDCSFCNEDHGWFRRDELRERFLGSSRVIPHVMRWSPARVLAECEAKRRIVRIAVDQIDEDSGGELLRLLALPYASHPDYREEWRP